MLAFLPDQTGRVAFESEAIHSFDYRQEQTHAVLRVQQEGVDGRYLAVLYPRAIGEAEPAFETASAQGAEAAIVALAGVRDLAWLRNGSASEVAVSGPDAHLVSDARFGYVRYVDGQLTRFAAQDATYLLADGETVFRASEMIDVSMERDDYAGFVRGPGAGYQLKMPHAGNEWTAARLLGGTWLGTAVEGEMIVLELAGEGTLELRSDQHVEAQKGAQLRPERYALHPNAPNPFNPTTKIRFDLPHCRLGATNGVQRLGAGGRAAGGEADAAGAARGGVGRGRLPERPLFLRAQSRFLPRAAQDDFAALSCFNFR